MADDSDIRVGRNVRVHLMMRRRLQREAAQALGMAEGPLSKRIHGVIPFRVGELERLATYLGVPLSALIGTPSEPDYGGIEMPQDPKDSASGTITKTDKDRAGGKLPSGSSVDARIRNGAQVANDAAANAKKK